MGGVDEHGADRLGAHETVEVVEAGFEPEIPRGPEVAPDLR